MSVIRIKGSPGFQVNSHKISEIDASSLLVLYDGFNDLARANRLSLNISEEAFWLVNSYNKLVQQGNDKV